MDNVARGRQQQKLVFGSPDHPTTLLKHLHKQWMDGKNCDLIISVGSCRLPVHSCVASCFSAKIGHHLHQAELSYACALSADQTPYKVTEDGIHFSFLKTGEKMVGADINQDIVKALIGFMYTGSLCIPRYQAMLLLETAQLLGFGVIVQFVEVFVTRNPDMVKPIVPSTVNLDSMEMPQTESEISERSSHKEKAALSETDSISAGDGQQTDQSKQSLASHSQQRRNSDEEQLHLDSVELDIKQETIDADLRAFLETQEQGRKEGAGSVGSELSVPDRATDRRRKGAAYKKGSTDRTKTLVIKQEHVEDYPVHFQNTDQQNGNDCSGSDTDLYIQSSLDNDDNDGSCEFQANPVSSDRTKVRAAKTPHKLRPFSCPHCSRSYSRNARLKEHVFKMHKRKKFLQKTCPHCDKEFQKEKELKAHCKEVHGDFVCEVQGCDFRTTHVSRMRTHQTRAHSARSHPCPDCDHQSDSKKGLRKHQVETHALYACSVCSRSFLQKENLTLHLRAVHDQDKFQCQQCKDCFSEESKLFLHCQKHHNAEESTLGNLGLDFSLSDIDTKESAQVNFSETSTEEPLQSTTPSLDMLIAAAVHSEQTDASASADSKRRSSMRYSKWKCQLCGKKQINRQALFQHLREEHKDEIFSCEQCPMTYLRKESLTGHVFNQHQGRCWTCPHCEEVFTVSTQFAAHCKTQHQVQKPFQCQEPDCSFQSASLRSLECHKKYTHFTERNEVCHKCGNCFPSQLYLRNHQRSCLQLEQHLCPTCGAVFNLRQSLLNHINNKHGGERRYSCSQCGQRFSCHANRNRHMRIHNNIFPYMCDICGQKFRHSNSLKDHVRRKHQTS